MKKNKKLLALLAVACVFFVGGTLAYFSDQESKKNTFTMGELDTDLEEKFDPPDDWRPGVEVEKEVKITNSGTVDVVAAARFEESCVRREDVVLQVPNEDGTVTDKVVAKKGEILPVIFHPDQNSDAYEELALKNFGETVVPYEEGKDPSAYEGKWVYLYDVKAGVYSFLYMGIVPAGEESPHLLESVRMNPKAEATLTGTKQIMSYDEEKGENVKTFTYTLSEIGYDSAHYELAIKAKTLQASKKAIQASWKAGEGILPQEFAGLLDHLATMCSR